MMEVHDSNRNGGRGWIVQMRAVQDHDLRRHVHSPGNRRSTIASSTIASDHGYDRRAHHRGHGTEELAGLLGVSKFPHEQHVQAERRIHPPFTGTITAIRCITADIIVVPPPPSPPPPSPPPCPPPSPPPCPPPSPPPCYVYTYPAPAPCPAYACPPRPACCLTRLFARRSHRNSCW